MSWQRWDTKLCFYLNVEGSVSDCMWLYKWLCLWLVLFTVCRIKCKTHTDITHTSEHYYKLPDCVNSLSPCSRSKIWLESKLFLKLHPTLILKRRLLALQRTKTTRSASSCPLLPLKLTNCGFRLSVLFITSAKREHFLVWNETS